jgi:ribosomal-protein-alanine acetyltransferase
VSIRLRDMAALDVAPVALIEASCFSAPWSLVMFREELGLDLSWHRVAVDVDEDHGDPAGDSNADGTATSDVASRGRMPGLGTKDAAGNEIVAGYLIGRLYIDLWHLANLAVAPDFRRRGVGTALLEEFLSAARAAGRDVLLEVRPSNEAGLGLYRMYGFELVGVRRHYYSDNQEDALVLELDVKKNRVGRR